MQFHSSASPSLAFSNGEASSGATTTIPFSVDESLHDMRIVVIDDEELNVVLLEHILESAGYSCLFSTNDAREAISLCRSQSPDLILLDWMMPHLNGSDVLRQLRAAWDASEFLPVMVLTADASSSTKRKALNEGAQDFLTKPFDQGEVLLRVRNLLATRALHVRQQDANRLLEEKVRERTWALEASQAEVLERLAQAAEFRDDDTGQHTRRVGDMAGHLAHQLGFVSERVELIRRAAPLHDVGKIGIADTILLKPGKLTDEEFEVVKTHTLIGAKLLRDGNSPLISIAELIALSHHERFDGRGYPYGLAGGDIPIEGRIVAVADVFDALTHERPYKRAWSQAEAVMEIQKGAGTQFDPHVVEVFLSLFPVRGN